MKLFRNQLGTVQSSAELLFVGLNPAGQAESGVTVNANRNDKGSLPPPANSYLVCEDKYEIRSQRY